MQIDSPDLDADGTSDAARTKRRKTIVDIAREEFIENGYGSTSMSGLASKLGGSKTTLWKYFPSKQELFAAVIDDLVERYGIVIENVPLPDGSIEETLSNFGSAVLRVVLSQEVLSLYRLVVGEAGRFPELGEIYYRKGVGRAELRLSAYLESQIAASILQSMDSKIAAAHFLQMCQANYFQKRMLNLVQRVTSAQINADVQAAVDAFLRAHALEYQ